MDLGERLLQAATVAAHSNFEGKGFRQKDVRFMAELMANWMDAMWPANHGQWHNTQIMRLLEGFVTTGLAKKASSRPPSYRLTRGGLVELSQSLSSGPFPLSASEFCFLHYFLKAYGSRIQQLIAREGSGFSKTLQLEIESHLDYKGLIANQRKALQFAIQRLQVRQKETHETAQLVTRLQKDGYPVEHIINEVAHLYPYDLNNQKPMEELFREIPPELRLWELVRGNQHRADTLWTLEIKLLQSFLDQLPK
ncbi:MAG: hypothetical protein H6624_09215 [Bdellovibrionaceae bacterium]|nr:hypothetical protein [Bdellovibrionales bacterium]MCB9084514.1 hypothetical protein [Pseudobdellovibrionaceae bacterium]